MPGAGQFTLTLKLRYRRLADRAARAEGRSFNNYVTWLILKDLHGRGWLDDEMTPVENTEHPPKMGSLRVGYTIDQPAPGD